MKWRHGENPKDRPGDLSRALQGGCLAGIGSFFVCLDSRPASLEQAATAAMLNGMTRPSRDCPVLAEGGIGNMQQFAE
jgi:hypothetical protein